MIGVGDCGTNWITPENESILLHMVPIDHLLGIRKHNIFKDFLSFSPVLHSSVQTGEKANNVHELNLRNSNV